MSKNGKGSAPRVQTADERKKFEKEYDRIFRKTRRKKAKA